jgi:cytochrome b
MPGGRNMSQQEVKVWDPFVRVFHWSLVLTFVIAYLSGEGWESLHVNAGYAVTGLIGLRLVWGLIGSRHARFSDFVCRPSTVRGFVRDTLKLHARRYLGHNPAGGAMILLMLASLLLTSLSGIALYGAEDAAGPLAALSALLGRQEEAWEEVHEFFANFTVFLVFIHIGGVIVESFIHRENLAKAMVTGRKRA